MSAGATEIESHDVAIASFSDLWSRPYDQMKMVSAQLDRQANLLRESTTLGELLSNTGLELSAYFYVPLNDHFCPVDKVKNQELSLLNFSGN